MRIQYQGNRFFSKMARTWVLLFSVPLYIGGTALWMKEEMKQVIAQEPVAQQFMVSLKKQVKPVQPVSFPQTFMLPTE